MHPTKRENWQTLWRRRNNCTRWLRNELKKNSERQRQAASRGQVPIFVVGDHGMVARVRRSSLTPKSVSTWTGPWRIVTADKVPVYGLHNIVTNKVKDVHVVRIQFYVDKDLEMTVASEEVFKHAFSRASF